MILPDDTLSDQYLLAIHDNLATAPLPVLVAVHDECLAIEKRVAMLRSAATTELARRVGPGSPAVRVGSRVVVPVKKISRTRWQHAAIGSKLITSAIAKNTEFDARAACNLILSAASISSWGQKVCGVYGVTPDDHCTTSVTWGVMLDDVVSDPTPADGAQ